MMESITYACRLFIGNVVRVRFGRSAAIKIFLIALGILALLSFGAPSLLHQRFQPLSYQRPSSPSFDQVRDAAVVDLKYARYRGVPLPGSQVSQWLGIRYAAPPIGDLRWRAPQDPLPASSGDALFADTFGPTCLGAIGPPLSDTTNEDCLFLNIFAPTRNDKHDDKAPHQPLLPVWFFIQGGGFAGNTDDNFNGTEVVVRSNHSIVFIQINYRVGAFGFLASDEMQRGDADLNVGLLDQRKALIWVQNNVHLFGGDPDHVVIHGDSAGAASVAYHLTAFNGRDDHLFVGAIAESPFWPTHRYPGEMNFQYEAFADGAGCSNRPDGIMACLRSKDTATLQRLNVPSIFPGATGVAEWSFLPVIDGEFATDYLYTLFGQGKAIPVPIIIGDATDEGTSFAPNVETSSEFLSYMKNNFPKLSEADLDVIRQMYPHDVFDSFALRRSYFGATAAAYGESTFVCPGIEMAESLSFYNDPATTWQYRYNVEDTFWTDMGRGVPHVSEKPAIFGPSKTVSEGYASYLAYNAPIVDIMMNYWLSFIRTLDPNTFKSQLAPPWQIWRHSNDRPMRLMVQLGATSMETVPSGQLDRCQKWKGLGLQTQQ